MSLERSQLARTMMSIQGVDREQSSRYPNCDLSERIERRIVLHQRRNGAVRCLGSVLVKIGRRLQQGDRPRPRPLDRIPTSTPN
jgi:hypothetical protein